MSVRARMARRRLLGLLAAMPAAAAASEPLTVGPGGRFSRLGDALRAAREGDTVLLAEGEYRGDVGAVERRGLVLRGLGRGAVLHADGRHAEGKATLVVRADATIENLHFRGARVPDGNGAGIRFERGHLALARCSFRDNEMGLLSGNDGSARLDIVDCEFADAPRHEGALHHLLYVGSIAELNLSGSRFGNGWRGHLVKSRARANVLRANWLVDGERGEASYELEFPNGGRNIVVGNVIAQSAATQNATLVSMAAEGGEVGSLLLVHNTLVDGGAAGARLVHLWSERLAGTAALTAVDNLCVGGGRVDFDAEGGGNRRVAPTELQPDYRPRREVAWIGSAVAAPAAALPLREFVFPLGSRALADGRALTPGALQPAP